MEHRHTPIAYPDEIVVGIVTVACMIGAAYAIWMV